MPYFTAAMTGYVPMLVAVPARPMKAALAVLIVSALFTALFFLEDKNLSGKSETR